MGEQDAIKKEESRRELDGLFFQVRQHHDALNALYGKMTIKAHLQPYTEARNERVEELLRALFHLCSDMPTKLDDNNHIQLNGNVWDWLSKRDQLLERVNTFYDECGGEL